MPTGREKGELRNVSPARIFQLCYHLACVSRLELWDSSPATNVAQLVPFCVVLTGEVSGTACATTESGIEPGAL